MATRGDPRVLRLVVAFLRAHANMTQAEFGKAGGVFQEAAAKQAVSVELVRRLRDYLKEAQRRPGLRFGQLL
jgi:hypothetical protein